MSARSLAPKLRDVDRRGLALPIGVAVRGLGWAVRQESTLLLRHWWPAAGLACLVSRSARRTVALAMVVDLAVAVRQQRGLSLVSFAGRRLDDLAYGAGLWYGAVRSGSFRCLAVRRARR